MTNFESIVNDVKHRLRMGFISALFLMGTTLVSLICIALPMISNPERLKTFDVGSVIVGSIMGQVVLLIAISVIPELMRRAGIKEAEDDEVDSST